MNCEISVILTTTPFLEPSKQHVLLYSQMINMKLSSNSSLLNVIKHCNPYF